MRRLVPRERRSVVLETAVIDCELVELCGDLPAVSCQFHLGYRRSNTTKCKVMHIGKKRVHGQYFINNHQLNEVKEEKDLEILISHDLKVPQQCQLAYNKVSRILGLINRTIEYKHPDILIRLYKSLVRPHLEYCVAAWSPHNIKDKELIERIQRRFTKLIPDLRSSSYEERPVSYTHLTLPTILRV